MSALRRVAEPRAERLIEELLSAQGWDVRRPPAGDTLAQQEYKDVPSLREALATCAKAGTGGAGVPEYVLVDRRSLVPLAVFEGKATVRQIDEAEDDVKVYGDAMRAAGMNVLAVAIAGTEEQRFEIRVLKWDGKSAWRPLTYEGNAITWVPDREKMARVLADRRLFELRPAIPPLDVLQARADEINGLLRESGLKDDFRPAAIGAIMLALWWSRGQIRRDPRHVLSDINESCGKAFWTAKKPDLALSLRVDEANEKLANRAPRICQILERLNITTLTAEHDYLGTLYEEFFRYTGGNTIGQYFTPRHITSLMAELCAIDQTDVVLDPAWHRGIPCGGNGSDAARV